MAPGLLLLLTAIYMSSPSFYVAYVYEDQQREAYPVELLTVGAAAVGGALLSFAAIRRRKQRLAASVVAVTGLAAIFFAGEEMSWGQSYLGWRTPESYAAFSGETNLHNSWLPVQTLGSSFLIAVFFVLPALWRWGAGGRRLSKAWEAAVASGPVVFCMATAFAWKELKNVYRWLLSDYDTHRIYQEFISHFNEHKEMLAAVGLLMFGVAQAWAVLAERRDSDRAAPCGNAATHASPRAIQSKSRAA